MAFGESIFERPTLEIPCDDLPIRQKFVVQSEPNSRTSSVKYKTRTNKLAMFEDDKRRNSLPLSTEKVLSRFNEDHCDGKRQQVRRVRSFRMTPKGIKKDSENERRLSNASIQSVISQKDIYRKRLSSEISDDSAICCGCSTSSSSGYNRVCLMGADAVGKSSLTGQFMSSEYLCSYDFENDELDEQTLSVVIDSEESTLEFIDFTKHQFEIEQLSIDAFLAVFSVHERSSFQVVKRYLAFLRNDMFTDRPIILVANKVDLVRKRQISFEEAKQVAMDFKCKYTETSATLNHQVDELLVGIVKEIKSRLDPEEIVAYKEEKRSNGRKGLLSKLFKRKPKVSTDILLNIK